MSLESMNRVLRHVWTEPRACATIEWHGEYSLSMQLEQQLGRAAMEQFASGGGWPDPEQRIELIFHEMPDWDWWEPRYDSPGRRLAARDAAFHAGGS